MTYSTFRVLHDAIKLVALMRPLWEKVGRKNRRLRVQMETAATSTPLNISEGMHRTGGHQRERFEAAMGSARECMTALGVSIAAGYLNTEECEAAMDLADKIAASLWRCLH
jgi:four helix bundle protein